MLKPGFKSQQNHMILKSEVENLNLILGRSDMVLLVKGYDCSKFDVFWGGSCQQSNKKAEALLDLSWISNSGFDQSNHILLCQAN